MLTNNTHILKTCDAYGWSRFAPTDEVKAFTEGNAIHTGMYFVVTDNYFPLKGNGWYFDEVVEKAIGYNLIMWDDIKYQVNASHSLPPTHFKQFVDEMFNLVRGCA